MQHKLASILRETGRSQNGSNLIPSLALMLALPVPVFFFFFFPFSSSKRGKATKRPATSSFLLLHFLLLLLLLVLPSRLSSLLLRLCRLRYEKEGALLALQELAFSLLLPSLPFPSLPLLSHFLSSSSPLHKEPNVLTNCEGKKGGRSTKIQEHGIFYLFTHKIIGMVRTGWDSKTQSTFFFFRYRFGDWANV